MHAHTHTRTTRAKASKKFRGRFQQQRSPRRFVHAPTAVTERCVLYFGDTEKIICVTKQCNTWKSKWIVLFRKFKIIQEFWKKYIYILTDSTHKNKKDPVGYCKCPPSWRRNLDPDCMPVLYFGATKKEANTHTHKQAKQKREDPPIMQVAKNKKQKTKQVYL